MTSTAEAAPDAQWVIARLEAAGSALLSLPSTGWSTRLRSSGLEFVRSVWDAYDPSNPPPIRPRVPSARAISEMDEALGWIVLIPHDRYVLRRIVGARALVHPVSGRYLFPWRRIGAVIGADHKAVQRWHAAGIDLLVAALNGRA